MEFVRAERKKVKLRLSLQGISGSGKTYGSLLLATGIGGKIALVDTERGSSSLFSDEFVFDQLVITPPFSPDKYIEAIKLAEKSGYDVLIVDSLSHAWAGEGGVLDMHSAKTNSSARGNSYTAWKDVTPLQNKLVETILQSNIHVIVTMRTKTHYDLIDDGGKKRPIKLGMAPIQRADLEFEFDCVFDLSQNNFASTSKDRTSLFKGKDFIITKETGEEILDWLNKGSPSEEIEKVTEEQLEEFNSLCESLQIPNETKEKWLSIGNSESFDKFTQKNIKKLIDAMNKKFGLKEVNRKIIENIPVVIQPGEIENYVRRESQ